VKIIADDKIPFLKGVLEPYAEVIYLPGKEISNKILIDADALLIRTRTRCNEELLSGSRVSFIATATIGYDHIDTGYCNRSGIVWTNAPGCNSSSVRQYIAAALVTIAQHSGRNLGEICLGIVGVGNVGTKVASFAKAVGMKVLLNDPPRERREGKGEFVGLDRILTEADIVTVHVPLTMDGEDKTYHLFDNTLFSRLKKGAWFINSSRGEVVGGKALYESLRANLLSGAVLDVWDNEPEIDTGLLSEVFIGTPHIAGYSTDGKANGTAMAVNALSEFFALPLKGWYPGSVPLPSEPVLVVDCWGRQAGDILSEVVLRTYDIRSDDRKLRSAPSEFEKQRGSYPVRREFHNYTVELLNGDEGVATLLRAVGFNVTGGNK
jgi:erythronate-4-phosphate dehydrogenase